MQEKVTERMNHLIPESLRNYECAAVDRCSLRGSDNRTDVTRFATNSRKDLCTGFRVRRAGQILVSGWNFRRANESGECADVGAVVFGIGNGIVVLHRVSDGCVLEWLQGAGDAHFVQVSVGCKRFQTRMLILPAKTSDAKCSIRLENRDANNLTSHSRRLALRNRNQSGVVDGFDESIAEGV